MLVVLQHLIHQCYHLGNLVALVGSKLVLDPSGERALFGIALLTLVNDFFIKDLHGLYDEASIVTEEEESSASSCSFTCLMDLLSVAARVKRLLNLLEVNSI